jgi:hypothetical protein
MIFWIAVTTFFSSLVLETELLHCSRHSAIRSIAAVIVRRLQSAYAEPFRRARCPRRAPVRRRLTCYAGPIDGDVAGLAESLGARLGAPVRLELQPV